MIHLIALHNHTNIMLHFLQKVRSELSHQLWLYDLFEDFLKTHCNTLWLNLLDVCNSIDNSDVHSWEEMPIYKGINSHFPLHCPPLWYLHTFFCLIAIQNTVSLWICVVTTEVEYVFSLVPQRDTFGSTCLWFVILTIKYFSYSVAYHSIISYRLRIPHSIGSAFRSWFNIRWYNFLYWTGFTRPVVVCCGVT